VGILERHVHGFTAVLKSGHRVAVEMRCRAVRRLARRDGAVVALDAVEVGAQEVIGEVLAWRGTGHQLLNGV